MTQEQLIQAMALKGFILDTHYSMDLDYESISMIDENIQKPSEEDLANELQIWEAAQARQAKLDRINALGDINLIIGRYIQDNIALVDPDEDSFNVAGFDVDRIDSSFGWSFKNLAKPSLEELEALKSPVDSEIRQAQRNQKLKQLRDLRQPLLNEVDIMINDVVLGLRSDTQAIIAYREVLKTFTDPYRWANDPNRAKVAIDALDLDNIQWPAKPE